MYEEAAPLSLVCVHYYGKLARASSGIVDVRAQRGEGNVEKRRVFRVGEEVGGKGLGDWQERAGVENRTLNGLRVCVCCVCLRRECGSDECR